MTSQAKPSQAKLGWTKFGIITSLFLPTAVYATATPSNHHAPTQSVVQDQHPWVSKVHSDQRVVLARQTEDRAKTVFDEIVQRYRDQGITYNRIFWHPDAKTAMQNLHTATRHSNDAILSVKMEFAQQFSQEGCSAAEIGKRLWLQEDYVKELLRQTK